MNELVLALAFVGPIHCSCGYKLWCEVRFEEDLVKLIFFDNVESSETYGGQITQCPGCGGRSFVEHLLDRRKG